jgi:hypothetical protein
MVTLARRGRRDPLGLSLYRRAVMSELDRLDVLGGDSAKADRLPG